VPPDDENAHVASPHAVLLEHVKPQNEEPSVLVKTHDGFAVTALETSPEQSPWESHCGEQNEPE
jgi:hypothetical protein